MTVYHSPSVNRAMPDCTIIPVLVYPDVTAAIEWLSRCFGFAERWHVGNHRAQLKFGSSAIAISEQMGGAVLASPARHSMLMRVDDVQSHYERSVKQGVEIISEPQDFPYGERQYAARDIGGHAWTFTQSIADTMPEDWGGVSVNL